LEQFRAHWQCLDNNNHQLWQCRPAEWSLNKCVFENLVRPNPVSATRNGLPDTSPQKLEKVIPDQPTISTPVHLRKRQIYAHRPILGKEGPFIPEKAAESAPSSS